MRGEMTPPQPGHAEPAPGRFVVALLLFVLLAATCLLLLLAALVFWLAALTGSMAAAALIVGGACLLLAVVVWLAALREPLARIGERLETVYEVARTAREGYRWITAKALPLLALFSLRPRPQEPRRGEPAREEPHRTEPCCGESRRTEPTHE